MRRFQRFTNDWPWAWRPVDVEDFTAQLRGEGRALSTIRAYQGGLRQFLDYVADPRYQWTVACERLFGTPPRAGVLRVEHRRARRGPRGAAPPPR